MSWQRLPVPYFHNVFTLPHELNPLILKTENNQRQLLKLLFDAAAQTLLEFGRQEFRGTIGFTLVLHTWDQQLRPHFHLHGLIASGALAKDGSQWIAGGRKFLFSVRALSVMFRAKFLTGFKELLDYLSRYTHRVALTNNRLIRMQNDQVTLAYRDRRDGDRRKQLTLPATKLIGRFLPHVLPTRFMRIRHYGFLASRFKQQRLQQIRQLLGVRTDRHVPPADNSWLVDWLKQILDIQPNRCPCCGDSLFEQALPNRLLLPSTDPVSTHPPRRPPCQR